MKKMIILLLLPLILGVTACKKDKDEPAPQAVSFTLTEATLNGQVLSPLPAYTLTLHWDVAGVPTMYEAVNTHPSAPAPGAVGSWTQNGTQLTFTSQDGSKSHQVQVSGTQVSALSSQIEVGYSMGKLDIPWPQVGDYTYTFERSQ